MGALDCRLKSLGCHRPAADVCLDRRPIAQELDFRNEAANGDAFRRSLDFLGYVDVPRTLPEYTTRRAMAMEVGAQDRAEYHCFALLGSPFCALPFSPL